MRIAIISDIHGNLEAFTEVMNDIKLRKTDSIYCLGDVINYGAQPNEVIELLIKENIPTILGNHEIACLNPEYARKFSEEAYLSFEVTMQLLNEKSKKFIASLPKTLSIENCLLVHGAPPASASTYIDFISHPELIKILEKTPENIIFVGHTHNSMVLKLDGNKITKKILPEGIFRIDERYKYVFNVSSVGQPRDTFKNKDAKYLIYDSKLFNVEVVHVKYDRQTASQKILDAGMPEVNAYRL
jgi:diadenosine tetraphosphatase ApaH/serine/threonine PP2A family protein phosphatase